MCLLSKDGLCTGIGISPVNGQFESILVTTRQLGKHHRLRPKLLAPLINHSAKELDMSKQQVVTKYQERVYTALQMIPEGRITSYAAMARALKSSPRAVGGALRVNPFAPEIPCHRCIASTGVR
jgi:O-6-methylguanine DNA methyltransferase